MKQKTIIAIVAVAVIAIIGLSLFPRKNSLKDNISYTLGQQIGQKFKTQGIEVEMGLFIKGFKDGLNLKNALTDKESTDALNAVQTSLSDKAKQDQNDNSSIAQSFLAENLKKPNIKELKPGVQLEVLQEGTGNSPSENSKVKFMYKGQLINGTVFDSAHETSNPVEIEVSKAIPGWQQGLPSMKAGGKYRLFLSPDVAYGNSSRPGIPAGSALIYDIDLIDVK